MSAVYHFGEHEPDSRLSRYVSCYWSFHVDNTNEERVLHTIPPDGCVNLACVPVPFGRRVVLQLTGARSNELTIPVSVNVPVWGVRFFPGTTSALLHLSGRSLHEQHLDAYEVMPKIAEKIRTRVPDDPTTESVIAAFDQGLLDSLTEANAVDWIVESGVRAIVHSQGAVGVQEISRELNVSTRHFQRLFREEVGLTPKEFARVRRFRAAAMKSMDQQPVNWSDIAARSGYSDQSHLSREFSSLLGRTPSEYQAFRDSSIRYGYLLEKNENQ